jgi:DNA mismatch repair protein PMS2
MKVVGQFNLGFIIGKLHDDLFIIDQHASDEKYNYETLQKTTVLHQQPLVLPMPLEVTAGEEMVIMDHLEVFQKNGISFQISPDAPATKKLKIVALPFSKHTQFGPEGTFLLLQTMFVMKLRVRK